MDLRRTCIVCKNSFVKKLLAINQSASNQSAASVHRLTKRYANNLNVVNKLRHQILKLLLFKPSHLL